MLAVGSLATGNAAGGGDTTAVLDLVGVEAGEQSRP